MRSFVKPLAMLIALRVLGACSCEPPPRGARLYACLQSADCSDGFSCEAGLCQLVTSSDGGTDGGDADVPDGGDGGEMTDDGGFARLVFAAQPVGGFSGLALPGQPTVQVTDENGAVRDFPGRSITLEAFASADCSGVALSALSVARNPLMPVQGTARFDAVAVTSGDSYSLKASAPGAQSACSNRVMPVNGPAFRNQASMFGVDETGYTEYGWAAWGDLNGDGRVDLVATVEDAGHRVYWNGAIGITPGPQLGPADRVVALADCDNDGDLDVMLDGANVVFKLYVNQGDGGFEDFTSSSGVTGNNFEGAAWLDADGDGRTDLVIPSGPSGSVRLWRNQGGCLFAEATDAGRLPTSGLGNGELVQTIDYDVDGDTDIFYAIAETRDGGGEMKLYRNGGDGTFSDFSNGANLNARAMLDWRAGFAFGDYDNDGDFDLFIGRHRGRQWSLLRQENGVFTEVISSAGELADARGDVSGATFGDFDNDGQLDLLVIINREADRLYRNVGDGTFQRVMASDFEESATDKDWSGLALADFDGDGDLDAYAAHHGVSPSRLYVNQSGNRSRVSVRVKGKGGAGKSPVDGIGTVVLLYDGVSNRLLATREVSGGGAMAQNEPTTHFGLANSWGGADAGYTVRVRFRSGIVTRANVVPGGVTDIVEP